MTTGSFEEARHCPKCEMSGEETGNIRPVQPGPGVTRGAMLHQFKCMNNRCKWYTTSWFVQINPDGTIPPPIMERDKSFKALPDDGGRTEANLQHLLNATLQPNSEIRGRG